MRNALEQFHDRDTPACPKHVPGEPWVNFEDTLGPYTETNRQRETRARATAKDAYLKMRKVRGREGYFTLAAIGANGWPDRLELEGSLLEIEEYLDNYCSLCHALNDIHEDGGLADGCRCCLACGQRTRDSGKHGGPRPSHGERLAELSRKHGNLREAAERSGGGETAAGERRGET